MHVEVKELIEVVRRFSLSWCIGFYYSSIIVCDGCDSGIRFGVWMSKFPFCSRSFILLEEDPCAGVVVRCGELAMEVVAFQFSWQFLMMGLGYCYDIRFVQVQRGVQLLYFR